MAWFKSNWHWATLNLFVVAVMAFVLIRGKTGWSANTFDPSLEGGKWAIRFLLICLAMTPLRTYLGWNGVVKLRKPAGLWAFGFAVVHVVFYVSEARLEWLSPSMPLYLTLGLLGLLILAVLAVTSNRWTMRRLKKHWKQLHRLVYLAGIAVCFHAIWATTMSKKMFVRDPEAVHELKFYLALLAFLLVVRIPVVRRLPQQIPLMLRHQHTVEVPIVTVTVPETDDTPQFWPVIYGRKYISAELQPEERSKDQAEIVEMQNGADKN